MKPQFNPKSWYIQLIHVAKGQLSMDDESYRSSLHAITRKTSCSAMNISELSQVLEFMKSKGFKPKAKKSFSPKSSDKNVKTMLDKLRQLWIQMSHQGFLNDGSEQALTKWAANQSKHLNQGEPVAKLEWLNNSMLYTLIEQLKNWHFRLIKDAFPSIYKEALLLNQEDRLSKLHQEKFFEVVQLMKGNQNYDTSSHTYSILLMIMDHHKKSVEQ
jgi:phage gp16-like protein